MSDAELIDGGRMQPMPLPESDWDRDLAAARAAAIAERDAAWVQAVREQQQRTAALTSNELWGHDKALAELLRAMGVEVQSNA